jgi:hypothetical protein
MLRPNPVKSNQTYEVTVKRDGDHSSIYGAAFKVIVTSDTSFV